jgi:DNA-binding MarR family transcriptional regulator
MREQGEIDATTDSISDSAEDRLIALLRRFSIEVDRFVEVFAGRHGLHRTDLNAVAHIAGAAGRQQPFTPGELARLLSLSPSATTAVLDRLERAGHVERVHDAADRRRVLVRMRPAAQDVATAFFVPLGRRMRERMAGYDTAELELVAGFLERMLDATAEAADAARRRDADADRPGQPAPPAGPAGRASR